ncbi:Calcium-dependent protein kinase 1 (PbCDPK1) [Durusdinium trenchii]
MEGGTQSTRLGSMELCPLPIGMDNDLRVPLDLDAPVASTGTHRSYALINTGANYPPLDTEAMLEDAEVVKLVHRVAVAIGSSDAYNKICEDVFRQHAFPSDGAELEKCLLPATAIPEVFQRLKIPAEHVNIFETVLRKETNFKRKPEKISFELFHQILIKVLRRIRDSYCIRIQRGQFVTRKRRRLEDEYVREGDCGRGCFGECFWVKHKTTGFRRVAKRIAKKRSEVPKEEVEDEMDILRKLDHPHIVRLFEWFESEDDFLLVMEGAKAGDLGRALQRAKQEGHKGLQENVVRLLIQQALDALVYIHSERVIHRDVKPANMVLTKLDQFPPHLLLADFGIACVFKPDSSSSSMSRGPTGTYAYMAPEVYDNNITPKVDVWALGIVAYECLCGHRPFGDSQFVVEYESRHEPKPVDMRAIEEAGASQAAVKFISWLLEKQEAWRPSSDEAQKEMNWPEVTGPDGNVTSLIGFSKKSTFSKAVYLCAASQMDTSSLDGLNDLFKKLDVDRNGKLSMQEFKEGLRQVLDPDSIEALVDALDMDHSGSADYSEFIAGCLDAHTDLIESALSHVFHVFDVNGDGKISLKELSSILKTDGSLSIVLPEGKTVEEFMKEIDRSQDGFISFEELKEFLQKEAAASGPVQKLPVQDLSVDRGRPSQVRPSAAVPGPASTGGTASGALSADVVSHMKRCLDLSGKNASLLQDLTQALAVPPCVKPLQGDTADLTTDGRVPTEILLAATRLSDDCLHGIKESRVTPRSFSLPSRRAISRQKLPDSCQGTPSRSRVMPRPSPKATPSPNATPARPSVDSVELKLELAGLRRARAATSQFSARRKPQRWQP